FDGKEAVFAGLAMRMRLRWQWAVVCPFPMIEPGPRIRQTDRQQLKQIGGGAFQPDRGRMDSPDRRVAALRAGESQYQDPVRIAGVGERHMHGLEFSPKSQHREQTAAQAIRRLGPDCRLHFPSGPGTMPGYGASAQAVEGIGPRGIGVGGMRLRHLSNPATFWNQATSAAGIYSPPMRTKPR